MPPSQSHTLLSRFTIGFIGSWLRIRKQVITAIYSTRQADGIKLSYIPDVKNSNHAKMDITPDSLILEINLLPFLTRNEPKAE